MIGITILNIYDESFRVTIAIRNPLSEWIYFGIYKLYLGLIAMSRKHSVGIFIILSMIQINIFFFSI